jgi:single-strand DNA-binding protein
MASYNKVILLGNLTREPQIRYTPSQTPVADFGLATNRRWKGQDGTERTETCFVDCTMFGRRAEVIGKYFHKGTPIFVEGRLTFESWQGQDGVKRSKLKVTIENFEFVGAAPGSGGGRGAAPAPDEELSEAPEGGEGGGREDEIPF